MTLDEAFDEWLDGPSPTKEPRRGWHDASELGKLRWAFTFGWLLGQEQLMKQETE